MKIYVLGCDGFLGWSLVQELGVAGHEVFGIDNFYRRKWVDEVGSDSIIPIESIHKRRDALYDVHGVDFIFKRANINNYYILKKAISDIKPDCIVNFAHQPSAPFSMIDAEHAVFTQKNNVTNNLNVLWAIRETNPKTHLVSLGTMGVYGTSNLDIPEGFFEIEYRGRKDTIPFPHQPWSFYHLAKSFEFGNMNFASKLWKLPITDINQGVVYGTQTDTMTDPRLRTRFDVDNCFGTAINRFCSQAVIDYPLTVYGDVGKMTRGFIALRDSMQCLKIAIENPPEQGEYRVFNQFDECYSIIQLAEIVKKVGKKFGIGAEINHIENPRAEKEKHYYNPDSEELRKLGFKPTKTLQQELKVMLKDLIPHKERIEEKKDVILPKIRWK